MIMSKAEEQFIEELDREHEIILGFQEYENKIAELEAKLVLAMSKLNIKEHQPAYCKLADRDCECMGKVEELKQQLAEKDAELVLARNTSINTNKMEILHLQIENEELKQQLALTEKALELACEEITGTCEYCPYATMPECPIEADCVKEKIKYFKQQAEKENKN